VVGGEEADRLIPPVVAQPAREQRGVVHELVHGEQLHGRHAKAPEMINHARLRQAAVGPAQLLGHPGMKLGKALDVELVDDRILECRPRRPVAVPVTVRAVHHRPRHERSRISRILAPDGRVRYQAAGHRARVRIKQELGRITSQSLRRVPRAMHAKPVAGTVSDPIDGPSPHEPLVHLQRSATLGAPLVEQAKINGIGDAAEHGEVRRAPVDVRPERDCAHSSRSAHALSMRLTNVRPP
jgi:hypothetical protein